MKNTLKITVSDYDKVSKIDLVIKVLELKQIVNLCIIGLVCLIIAIVLMLYLQLRIINDPQINKITNFLINNNSQSNDSLYNLSYEYTPIGVNMQINNICVEVMNGSGVSMKPFISNKTLILIDKCFNKSNLMVGDIVAIKPDFVDNFVIGHRIIDIDHNKEWVKTQGDNPITNSIPDDYTSFDNIYGKIIGYLNLYG
jgi:hypothetical protein